MSLIYDRVFFSALYCIFILFFARCSGPQDKMNLFTQADFLQSQETTVSRSFPTQSFETAVKNAELRSLKSIRNKISLSEENSGFIGDVYNVSLQRYEMMADLGMQWQDAQLELDHHLQAVTLKLKLVLDDKILEKNLTGTFKPNSFILYEDILDVGSLVRNQVQDIRTIAVSRCYDGCRSLITDIYFQISNNQIYRKQVVNQLQTGGLSRALPEMQVIGLDQPPLQRSLFREPFSLAGEFAAVPITANLEQSDAPPISLADLWFKKGKPKEKQNNQANPAEQPCRDLQSESEQFPCSQLGADFPGKAMGYYGDPISGSLLQGTALSGEGVGFRSQRADNPNYKNEFGAGIMLKWIEYLGKVYIAQTQDILRIGDISKENGGKLAPHVSHQNGLDVDIGLPKSNGKMDVAKSWELLKAAFRSDIVHRMGTVQANKNELCKLAKQKNEFDAYQDLFRNLVHWEGHETHFHFRLKCTSHNQQQCRIDATVMRDVGCPK